MEAMGSPILSHNMSYVVAQAMFYLVTGARRIQLLNEMVVTHSGCSAREGGLRHRIFELESDVRGLEQKCMLLASEKTVLEEIQYALERKVDSLTQVNEGLVIQNESLERDVVDRDKLVATVQADVEAARHDRDWLLHVGVVCIWDKSIEHPEFTSVMSLIRHVTFVVGEESDHSNLTAGLDSGSYDLNTSSSRTGHVLSVNDALLAFSSMDHASLLGLGDLDMQGFQELCAFDDAEETLRVC